MAEPSFAVPRVIANQAFWLPKGLEPVHRTAVANTRHLALSKSWARC